MHDPAMLSATEASALLSQGRLSSEDLVRACLARISERDRDIKAWVWLDEEHALDQARRLDQQPRRSPVHGIPVGVKDIIDTKDMPTARGSTIHADRAPSEDAACVAALREAGAVILGKTVTTEFAASHPGPTRNPHAFDRTPGGSSSGSAAAVADGMVPLALGTQTSGSVVRPASFCGVFGLKPTFGAWPTRGVQPLAWTLDTLGVFARDPRDLSLVHPFMGGAVSPPRSAVPPERIRMGFARTPFWDQIDPAGRSLIEELVASLREQGLELTPAPLPDSFESLAEAQLTIFAYESARALSYEYEEHRAELSEFMRGWLPRGRSMPAAEYATALRTRMRAGQDIASTWDSFDVLLAPAVTGEAPPSLDWTGDPLFCRPWTTLGLPALAVPLLTGPGGLPLGMQVIGPPGSEGILIAAAHALVGAVAAQS